MRDFSEDFWWGTLNIRLSSSVDQWSGQAVTLLLSTFGKKLGVFFALPSMLGELMELEAQHLKENIAPLISAKADEDDEVEDDEG